MLATAINIPVRRINDILVERQQMTADIALRLGRYFGNQPTYWLNLQTHWLLQKAEEELEQELVKISPLNTTEVH